MCDYPCHLGPSSSKKRDIAYRGNVVDTWLAAWHFRPLVCSGLKRTGQHRVVDSSIFPPARCSVHMEAVALCSHGSLSSCRKEP